MTADFMEDWVKNVWEERSGALRDPQSTLL
jgi:hypothetical protein